MARATANKLYRNFVRGLITEASELTYPENSCSSLDNCVISRKGNITRRFGLDFEPNAEMSPHTVSGPTDEVYQEYMWEAVATRTSLNFLVTQTSTTVRFYDLASNPLSSGLKSFQINMTNYLAPNTTTDQAENCELQFFSGKGFLWIVGKYFEPLIVTYDPLTDAITVQPLYILMRDFTGVNDGLANDAEPTTLSTEHHYNLLNQGWVNPENAGAGSSQLIWDSFGNPGLQDSPGNSPITDYFTATSRYPGNNKQWWLARDSTTNAFDPDILETLYYGTSRAARGHFIVNAFYKDRSAVSGLAGLPVEVVATRPTAGAFFSGRAWYVADQVYFSQVLDDKSKAGLCFQEADPTAEAVSDLIATDGGVIPIPEMGEALRAFPAADGLLIFANNGVWFISGGSGGFSALDFTVIKVSSIGTQSPHSIVDSKRGILWHDRVGLRVLTVASGSGGPEFDLQTISEETIQSYVQYTIPKASKPYIKGVYDAHTNTVQWLYDSTGTGRYSYDRMLNLDMTLGAFYPYSLSREGPRVVGVFERKSLNEIDNPWQSSVRDNGLTYRIVSPTNGVWHVYYGYFRDYTFADFKSYDGTGFNFVSFLEAGYELLDDTMRKKKQNYIYCYFRRTEENWLEDGPDNPSSCYFQTKWDWSSSELSNKWTNKVQVYRHTRLPFYNEDNPVFDTGHSVVVTKNKVRGHGRSIQFRFESDGIGKNFDLLGWAVAYSGNTDP